MNKERPTRKVLNREILHNRWLNIYPYIPKAVEDWKYDMGCDVIRSGNCIVGVKPKNNAIDVWDMGGTAGMKDVLPEFMLLPSVGRELMQDMFQFRYFHDVCETLYKAGYRDGRDVFGIPYDFRLVLDPEYREDLFSKFQEYIEVATTRAQKKCVLFAHSLGAVMLKWFLSSYVTERWAEEHIQEMILVSPPFGGAPISLKTVMFGDFYLPQFHNLYKDTLQVNTGVILCLPNHMHYMHRNQEILRIEGGESIGCTDYNRLATEGHVSFQIWRDLYRPYLDVIAGPVGVKTTVYNAVNNDTAVWYGTPSREKYPSQEKYEKGDSIIVPMSHHWYRNVFRGEFADVRLLDARHIDIISNRDVLRKLLEAAALNS